MIFKKSEKNAHFNVPEPMVEPENVLLFGLNKEWDK